MSNELQTRKPNPVAKIKNYLDSPSVKERFDDMLDKRAGAFTNSIINVVRNSASLQKCSPESVISAAMGAATLNLAIDPSLGQAAIVPYGNTAQFQIMYKGVIQLCIRSGQYERIHCTEIYKDEIVSWNAITGEIEFTALNTWKMRYEGKADNVAGHYARLTLLAGFKKCDYMTVAEALGHAKKYSKAYQYDLKKKNGTSAWSTDPVAMGNKTVILRLLKKYGVMSIEMQKAFVADHESFEDAQDKAAKQIESETGSEIIDVEPTEVKETETPSFMED